MIPVFDDGLTEKLSSLISGPYKVKDAMDLIYQGADPKIKDKNGYTLLHALVVANTNCKYDQYINDIVTKYQVGADILSDNNETPYKLLISSKLTINSAINLIRLGADVNTQSLEGNTVLHWLLHENQQGDYNDLISELIEKFQANPNIKNNMKRTPLECYIAKPYDLEFARKIVQLGGDPHVVDYQGKCLQTQLFEQVKVLGNETKLPNKSAFFQRHIRNLSKDFIQPFENLSKKDNIFEL